MVFVLVIKIHSSFLNIKIHCINLFNTSNMDRFRKKPRHIADVMLQFGTACSIALHKNWDLHQYLYTRFYFNPFRAYTLRQGLDLLFASSEVYSKKNP